MKSMPGLSSGTRLPGGDLAASGANSIYAVVVLVTLIATVGVVLRFVSRRKSNTKLAWDDFTIVVALVLLYGLNILGILSVALWGLGGHVQALTSSEISSFQKAGLASFLVYFATCATIKASLLLLYYRLFKISQRFRLALIITAVVVFGWLIAVFFAGLFQCVPLQAFWDRSIRNARCYSVVNLSIASGVTNLLTDVMILAVPMPMVWTLHTNKTQKAILTGIFLLGLLVCAVSVVRIVTLTKVDHNNPTSLSKDVFIWTSVEPSIGVLSACLPTMRPLFGRLFHLSTRTAVTPKGNNGASGASSKKPTLVSESTGPAAPAKEGFARIDEESTIEHTPLKAARNGSSTWRRDNMIGQDGRNAIPMDRMKCKPDSESQTRRQGSSINISTVDCHTNS